MLTETNEYAGLADWQAATLYLGFLDDNEPIDELVELIKKNSEHPSEKENNVKWRLLHEAVGKFDFAKIKQLAADSKGSDLPWPTKLRKQGERYHRAIRMFFS